MGFENYISEAEAAQCAGVSLSTLARFVEAGYLEIEQDADGVRLFSRRAVETLFGITPSTPRPTAASPIKEKEVVLGSSRKETSSTASFSGSSTSQPFSADTPATSAETIEPTPVTTAAQEIPAQAVTVAPLPASTPNNAPAIDRLEREVAKFKNIIELQEKILEMKDQQIKSLSSERDWLRERQEKLEQKAERDQLLLLAETQTIRQLISIQERRRSPLRSALEWIGLVEPPKTMGTTIEMSQPSSTAHNTAAQPREN